MIRFLVVFAGLLSFAMGGAVGAVLVRRSGKGRSFAGFWRTVLTKRQVGYA